MELILASQSPQRKAILKELGLTFRAVPADIDEHHSGLQRPHAIVKSIALRKAKKIAESCPGDWVIAADTIVVFADDRIAIKPRNIADARRMLEKYQDSHCSVYSGLAILNQRLGEEFVGYERSKIHFGQMEDREMEKYLKSGDWKERSGAITIETAEPWVSRIEGEYWNIVGLPVDLLKKKLRSFRLV